MCSNTLLNTLYTLKTYMQNLFRHDIIFTFCVFSAPVIGISFLSVHLSVTRWYCAKRTAYYFNNIFLL